MCIDCPEGIERMRVASTFARLLYNAKRASAAAPKRPGTAVGMAPEPELEEPIFN